MGNPSQPVRWPREQAAHLLARAGFGATPDQVEASAQAGLFPTVENLLRVGSDEDLFPPEDSFADKAPYSAALKEIAGLRNDPEAQRQARRRLRIMENSALADLRAWWLQRLRHSPHPLREKMTLFWHGHFATSVEKTRSVYLLWRQNELFRMHALGNFGELARAIPSDPAMMRYLDIAGSSKEHPNENFAREVMELFLLGEGHYTEEDIREAARAFAGWRINPASQMAAPVQRKMDDGEKKLFGQVGRFGATDAVDVILSRPQCAPFIAGKVWKFFAGRDPTPRTLGRLAERFRASRFDTSRLLRAVFLEEEFYSPAVMGTQIKSPVEWLVGAAIRLEEPISGSPAELAALDALGQKLFQPPNVRGWEGGKSWMSVSAFLSRCNLAYSLFLTGGGQKSRLFPEEVRKSPEAVVASTEQRLFPMRVSSSAHAKLVDFAKAHSFPADEKTVRELLRFAMTLPEFQLT